jgi:hypothetical protein
MIKTSKASKMPCLSWSLQAISTCPGSLDHETGLLVPACQGCYATDGNYNFPNVIASREHNREDWKRELWVDDMVYVLRNQSLFRWFDSGDVYSVKLARKILDVMRLTPHVKHWLPTRMHKFLKFEAVFNAMNALDNVVVRFSGDEIDGSVIPGKYVSSIFDPEQPDQLGNATMCTAYEREGKCIDCRACWSKDVEVIAYPQHGRKMAKVNRLSLAIK